MTISKRQPLASFAEQYRVGEEIGNGKFAIVKRCIPTNIDQHHHHGCAEVAAKFIRKSRSARFGQKVEDIELEIAILTELRHNNIIQLIDVFEDVTQVILVFELMKGGELQDYITDYDRLTESEARVFLRQILSAVVHLHERSIVHLDLKPENILLTEPGSQHLKIIDFGISRRFDAKADIKGVYGTPEFIAPEILNYESIGYGTDIWAIGCIAYTMLYGQSPFLGDSKNETFTNITRATFEFDDQICDISSLGRDFIKQCLVKDIRKRMTACDAFNHEWITTIDTIPIDHVISLDSLVDSCHQTMSMFGVKSGVGGGNRSDGSDSLINGAGSLIDTSPSPTSTTTIDSSTSTIPSRSSSIDTNCKQLQSIDSVLSRQRWKRAYRIIILYNRHQKRRMSNRKMSKRDDRRRRRINDSLQNVPTYYRSSSSHSLSIEGTMKNIVTDNHDENFLLAALFGAIEEGNIHSIEELFAASAIDPNQCNKHGESLLHYCAGLGQLDIFKFLCQIGANLNVLDDQDDTVIHWAARQNHPHIIRYIYEQTASVEMVNKNLETPLHVAARYGHVEAIEQLCKCGANINAIDEHGETAILIAVWHGFPKIVHILGEIGANTNIRNKEDETALHVASARGHHECVRCLLDAGADANLRNKNSYTPLHLALKRQHSAVAMLLLKSGADYELADSSGERAIHYVARYNLVPICQWLCQSLNGTTNLPSTPTSGTPPTTPTMITNTIGGHQSSGQSLSLSSQQSQPPPQPRCNVNVPNKHGLYPLHIAAKSGHIEIVRTLCLAGSIVDQRDKDSIIPQICAIAQSHNDIADLLTRLRNERQKEEFIGQLSQTNQQPLNRIKLRIFGHCASGKSTLIESMKCGYFSSWFRRSKVANGSQMLRSKSVQTATNSSYATTNLNTTTSISTTTTTTSISSLVQPIETVSGQLPLSSSSIINHHQSPISSYENATKGIDCQQLYISGVGDLSLWEFSGNPIYYQLYDHFISDLHCLNAIVFRLADPPEVQLQSILFWLQFISSRQQITEPLLHCGKSAQHSRVILIATHADLVIQSGFYGTGTESEIVTHLNQMLANVCLKYGNQFDIYEQIFMMDASVAGSAGMKQLKAHLQQAKQSVLTNQYVLPYSTRFLDSVLTFLNLFRKVSTNFPVLAYHQFKDMIRSQINPLASDDHFKDLIEQLVIMGEICFLRTNSVANCDLLVLNPKWLCCDIIGNLLLLKCNPSRFINSLPQLPNTILSSHVNGIYSIDEFQELYSDVDALDLLQLLETLSLCTQNDRSGDIEYEFPCFILSGDIDQTMDHFQYRENCVYHGVVYHRSIGGNVNGPVLTSIFPRIQTNLRSYLRKHSTYDVDDLHNCLNYSYFISSSESSDEHTNDSDEHDHHQNRMMAIISVDTVSDWIDVRFCCPFDHRCDAFHLMQELLHSIELTITEVAPGLLYRKSYYSPEQLKNQRENYSLFSSASLMRSMLGMGPDSSNNKNTNSSKVNTTTSSSYQLLKRTIRSDDSLVEERICDILCFGITNLSDIGQPIPGGGTVEPSLAHELHSSNLSVMTKQQLCQLLDPPESIGRDWCMFGILLGMTDKLPKLDPTTGSRDSLSAQMIAMNQIPSPTARVIEECVRSATCTIKILVEKLTELNRFDAVDVILQTGPLLRTFPLSSLPEEGTVYNDESSHTSLGISTMSHTSSSNLSR